MSFAKKTLFRTLRGLRGGCLEIALPDGSRERFGDPAEDLRARIDVHDERFFSRLLWGGNDEAGDAYMDGDWSTPDLVAVCRIAVRNVRHLEEADSRWAWLSRFAGRLAHRARANTIAGSKKNIAAHYDLSNDFFRLWLDDNMLYSAAAYRSASDTLEEAQLEKIDRLCRKLRLTQQDRLLEIGTGWGGFALHAARHYGCHVTTTTISQQQHDCAAARFAEAGLTDRIRLLQQDYRKLTGTYDKICSIEMFEAVGFANYDEFFGACDRLLAPDGVMAMQTITMNEQNFADYMRHSDWIQKRIFPGGELASVAGIQQSIARRTRLGLVAVDEIGLHYAYTLEEWRRRFWEKIAEVRALGFDEKFIRMWDFYLGYCEAAFRERYIGDVQIVLAKVGTQRPLMGEPWGLILPDAELLQDRDHRAPVGESGLKQV